MSNLSHMLKFRFGLHKTLKRNSHRIGTYNNKYMAGYQREIFLLG